MTLSGGTNASLIPTWPHHGTTQIALQIAPKKISDMDAGTDRILVIRQGQDYEVVPDRPLEICNFVDSLGDEHKVVFRVKPGSKLGL